MHFISRFVNCREIEYYVTEVARKILHTKSELSTKCVKRST